MLQQMENGHNCTRNRLKLANAMHTCRPQGNEKRMIQICLLKFKGFAARGCPYYIFTRCIIKAVRRQSVWLLDCRLQMLMCKSYYSWCSSQHQNRSPASSPDMTAHSAAETSHYLHTFRWTQYFPLTADVSVTSDKNGKNHAKLSKTGT